MGKRQLQWAHGLIAAIGLLPVAAMTDTVEVTNTATLRYREALAEDIALELPSNTVNTVVTIPPPIIRFFRDSQFQHPTHVARSGAPLYLEVSAEGCEHDRTKVETVTITVTSRTSHDLETYVAMEMATETAPDSAVFRVQEHLVTRRTTTAVTHQDGVLHMHDDDMLTATIEGCAGSDTDNLLIDPVGRVFDSASNDDVAGARVRLIDVTGAGNGGRPGADAVVFDFDGVTSWPSTVVTTADGIYQFPLVAPSEYRLVVTPPGDYIFPSTSARASLASDRIVALGSYGETFPVNADTGTVQLDVPLDSKPSGLVIDKRANRSAIEIAESLEYSVDMRNISGVDLSGVVLHDVLPPGFSYIPKSARLDGVALGDPTGGKGPALDFAIGELGATARKLTYRVIVGAGAAQGDGINRAQLFSASPARKQSNLAQASVKVMGGVFDERGYVLGKVFADCNANGVQDAGEAGVPQVRLFMEDGTSVITDAAGKYSLYGVSPRAHVLKVDRITLPLGVGLTPFNHRQAGRGDLRFIDIKRGELYRADFATTDCSTALVDAITQRRDNTSQLGRELALGLKNELRTGEPVASLGDVRALPASGIVGDARPNVPASKTPAENVAMVSVDANTKLLSEWLPRLDGTLDFIGLQDGDAFGITQATIRVKGPLQAQLQLEVNAQVIGEDRIGTRITDEGRKLQVIEFVGVNLSAGDNELTLLQRDPWGNLRDTRKIRIAAAGSAAHLAITAPTEGVPADGERTVPIEVLLRDADGVRVATRTPITLDASLGTWEVTDLDAVEAGVQTFLEGGRGEYSLRAPLTTGAASARVTSGDMQASTRLSFVAALRPLIGAGIVESMIGFSNRSGPSLAARSEDGFERELRSWARSDDSEVRGARAALFLKGKIRGDYLLTLGYDSDKSSDQRLFRDIQPDEFYPVYGDSSIKSYDAQSTNRLYVRIDRNRSYLLGGDISTQRLSDARDLGAYNRSLTGIKEHYETDTLAVDAFASYGRASQVIEEQPANGTSGPFQLNNTSALENSEQVEILTRDRNQPNLILQAVPQQRFSDYEIEPLTGRILFRSPVPSLDADLNPISVRITYEVRQGGEDFWTTGVDTRLQLTPRVQVGGAVINDGNPLDQRRIVSANTTFQVGAATKLIAELARTDSDLRDSGTGQRLELRHDSKNVQWRTFAGRTDADFNNSAATLSANRSEAGFKGGYSLTETTRLVGELLHSKDLSNGAARDGGLFGVERSLDHNIKLEAALRHVRSDTATDAGAATLSATSARTKVSAPLPFAPKVSLFGEYEQDLADADSRVVAAGGSYQLANRSKLYARHELISSLQGPYALDPTQKHQSTVFGIDTGFLDNDHLFSEYRVADALSGREAQAAIGLRNGWQLAPGLRANTTFERTDALAGSASGDSSAVTGALEYTRNPLWKGTARLELRDSQQSEGMLATLGLAYKLSEDWTFLGKHVSALTTTAARPDREQTRLQLGLAYRDADTNRFNALLRYELKREAGLEAALKRQVHAFSAHADYQATPRTSWGAQYAAKLVQEQVTGLSIGSSAHLLAGRVTQDIGTRWDIGVHARGLFNTGFGSRQSGIGAEAGYLVRDGMWVSLGYNVCGFSDGDLAEAAYTNRGIYFRMRWKFDESLLERF